MTSHALVADIGATNARFALLGEDGTTISQTLKCRDHPSFEAAVRSFLNRTAINHWPKVAAVAIAGPVLSDRVEMTNHPWEFSIQQTQSMLGLDKLLVINDFTAQALAVTKLTPNDVSKIGGGEARSTGPVGVLGPGTGLGVSGLVHDRGRWLPLAGEGGHVTLCATTQREEEVIACLRKRFGHVSAERALSGQGLVNLYTALATIDHLDVEERQSHEITAAAIAGDHPVCLEAVELFCAFLGSIAGNLALTLGATGGVYIAGGIVPKLGSLFHASSFRSRFESKGRFFSYQERIPTYLITRDIPAFLGLQALLEMQE